MRYRSIHTFGLFASTILAGTTLASTVAHAQGQADSSKADEKEIIVTGTLIKGIAPVGSPVIGISTADIQTSGVTSATDLLREIPQTGDFNSLPQPATNSSVPYSPIQLRGIGGLSGMATLILIDGQRVVPSSPSQNWIDTQMIPAGVIERVEVVTDGGSSIYGSDAVAGVVNFITKRKAKGLEVGGSYGLGMGSNDSWEIHATAGHEWSSGSAVLSYSYSHRNPLLGKDLPYLIENQTALGGSDYRSTSCAPGTVTANGVNYALPGKVAGTTNYCSAYANLTYFPSESRHALFGTLTQEIGDATKLEVNAYWSRRAAAITDPVNARSSGTITSSNPYFSSIAGETSQSVAFSYENAFGVRKDPSVYEAWQVTPTLTTHLSPRWTARLGLNLGISNSVFDTYSLNGTAQSAALAATTAATALNPYDPSASNASVLAGIADWITRERSHQEIREARLVFDGSLFDLPAGTIKTAVGGEFRQEIYNYFNGVGPVENLSVVTDSNRDRKIASVFGEVYVPVLRTLRLTASARYDHYSDVGSTTNPKVGFTYEPQRWVSLRGSWGTAFHAPSLADLSAPLSYSLFLPISPFRAPGSGFADMLRPTIFLTGAAPGLKPETATTWSLGADFKPAHGLKISTTYWNIDYSNRIDQNAGIFYGSNYYTNPANSSYYLLNPANPAAVIAKFGNYPVSGYPSLATLFAIFGSPYVVADQRKMNMGTLKMDGIDLNVHYDTSLAGGTLRLGLNGTYLLDRNKEAVLGTGYVDTLRDGDFNNPIPRMNASASVGWGGGPFDGSVTVFRRGSADVGTERIDSFTTVSVFAKYNLTKEISASINVDNLLNTAPPFRLTTNGVAFIDQGRVVKFGINSKF